jgi:hypothetical protein
MTGCRIFAEITIRVLALFHAFALVHAQISDEWTYHVA